MILPFYAEAAPSVPSEGRSAFCAAKLLLFFDICKKKMHNVNSKCIFVWCSGAFYSQGREKSSVL